MSGDARHSSRQGPLPNALLLKRVADGEALLGLHDDLVPLQEAGLLHLILPEDATQAHQYAALMREGDDLRAQLQRLAHPRGRQALALKLLAGARRVRSEAVAALQGQLDHCSSEIGALWLSLSQRGLLQTDLELCASDDRGGFAEITDAGREAVRSWQYSAEFERTAVRDDAVIERVECALGARRELLAAGSEPDCRLDLAAVILCRKTGNLASFQALNALAVQRGWRSYDRLPLLAALSLEGEDAHAIWERFWCYYQALLDAGYPGGHETRYSALALRQAHLPATASLTRLSEIARRLRLDGWSISPTTDPVAAMLTRVRLSPSKIATRVQRLFGELDRGGSTRGAFLGLAAVLAANSNLHPLAAKADGAQIGRQSSPFEDFIRRYDMLLKHFTGEDSRRVIAPALLALLPGTVEGNLRRYNLAVQRLATLLPQSELMPLALTALDSASLDWADTVPYVWALSCLLPVAEEVSVFGAFQRMSPMITRAAAAAAPEGPKFGS